MLDEEVVEELKRSIESVGQIYLVYRDADTGEIVAGRHRAEACKRLGREPKTISIRFASPKNKLLFMIHSNIQRSISREERAEQLNELARILREDEGIKGSLVKRIAQITPFSEGYIQMLLRDEYKREYIPHEEIAYKPAPHEEAEIPTELGFREEAKPPKIEVKVRKPTQEEIKEQIRAPISTVNVEVPALLSEMGVTGFTTQEPICVYELIPDVVFPQQRIAVFFDGPGHPEDLEEEEMREALKRRGWRVLELRYSTLTDEVKRELARQVAEEAGFKPGSEEPTIISVSKPRRFQCPYCSSWFVSEEDLAAHLESDHLDIQR
jgi:very-short-patch-repair endonuclease